MAPVPSLLPSAEEAISSTGEEVVFEAGVGSGISWTSNTLNPLVAKTGSLLAILASKSSTTAADEDPR